MGWYAKPNDYKCKECAEEFQFVHDTLFIASHGGLPIKCPNCKSENVNEKYGELTKKIKSGELQINVLGEGISTGSGYGYDINGKPITAFKESKCPKCGNTTRIKLSDGSDIGSSCGCDYVIEICHANTDYVVIVHDEYHSEVFFIKGYKEAKEKYNELIATLSTEVCTMAQVIKTYL